MLQKLRFLVLALAIAVMPGSALAQVPAQGRDVVRIAYLVTDGETGGSIEAWRTLLQERPDLAGRLEFQMLSSGTLSEIDAARFAASDILLFNTHDEHVLEQFDEMYGLDLLSGIDIVLGVGTGLRGEDHWGPLGVEWDPRARAYWENGQDRRRTGGSYRGADVNE